MSAKPKHRVRSLLEALGSLVLEDPVLFAKHGGVGGGDEEEEDGKAGVEGLRCYYCFDEVTKIG